MRQTFIRTLVELGEKNKQIVLLTGDLGYTVVEPFAERFPDRFFNVGVAEQNMVGVATGLAEAGFIPYVYSIVTFVTLRPYEFVRNGPIHHHSKVRIVGAGTGLEYGTAGASHHGLEDVGVMRIQPGIQVIVPADAQQARSAFLASWDSPGPVYYGIGKDEKYAVPGLDGHFALGRVDIVREGRDIAILAMGGVVPAAISAADTLAARDIQSEVVVVANLAPVPESDLVAILRRYKTVLTVEAHYVTGGLGSLVSEVIAEHGSGCRLVRCAVKNASDGRVGSRDYLHGVHGLSAVKIVESVLGALQRKP